MVEYAVQADKTLLFRCGGDHPTRAYYVRIEDKFDDPLDTTKLIVEIKAEERAEI